MSWRNTRATGKGSSSGIKSESHWQRQSIRPEIAISPLPFRCSRWAGSPPRVRWATCRARNISSTAGGPAAFVSAPSRASEALYHGFGSDNGHFPQIQGCPALPLEALKKKKERKNRIPKRVAQGPSHLKDVSGIHSEAVKWEPWESAWPREMLASLRRVGDRGQRVGAGLLYNLGSALWRVLFQDLSRSPEEDKAPWPPLSARCPLPACGHFRGQTEPGRWPPPRPAHGPGRPSSPLGPRRVLSLTSGVCVAARACECGRGRGPSELLHPSVLLGTH